MKLFASLALLIPLVASPQGGYANEKHPELGMDFPRPRSYKAVPTSPTDTTTVLYFVEKERRKQKAFRPELRFLLLEAPETEPDEPRRTKVGARPGTFESFFEDGLKESWRIVDREEGEARDGFQVFDYTLDYKKRGGFAWARAFEKREGSTVILGVCSTEESKAQLKIWRKMADDIEFYEPQAADVTALERYYDRRDYSLSKYRIGVRRQLVKGWEADDTENFILVYSTRDQSLLRVIKSELEAIRKEYVKLFPPAREVTAISTVRICKDREEYFKYGGPKSSGGYWNSAAEELVFFDYENVDKKMGSGKADTRIVLYHEAFHQYVFYAVGEVAPHSWFNEGTGDYFSGAKIKGGKVKAIGVNPWRVGLIQQVIERGLEESWEDIIGYEQAEFYEDRRQAICYAQAWSMIYFLRKSRDVQKHPVWSQILDGYFEELKSSTEWEQSKLPEEPTDEQLLEANKAAREAALKRAFHDVNLFEIEEAWREYTMDLKVPK
jgi:hypothetical protein